MEPQLPEKRFEDFEEVFNAEGLAIGFTLPGNNYFFKYESDGGWVDEKGTKYNSDGIAQKIKDQQSQGDDEEDDEEILDQFQKMLGNEDHKKNRKEEKKIEQIPQQQNVTELPMLDYEKQTGKYIEQYKNKQKIRDGLPPELLIYYKMKRQYYQDVVPEVQKQESIVQKNAKIKEIHEKTKAQSDKLKENNKWLNQEGQFDFSGVCEDDKTYQRYWYGHIKANPENYLQLKQEIENSKQFALLEVKTFYALKSKFYLKKKMQQTIQDLAKSLQEFDNDHLVTIIINSLPENFPCSYILDLFEYSATSLSQIHSINLLDQYTAELKLSKQGAIKFLNVEGFSHDQKDYIYLDIEGNSEKVKIQKSQLYKITTDSDYKIHYSQLCDTMTLSHSASEIVKTIPKQQQKQKGYRLVIGQKALKKVLMYRGSTLNITKIELYLKQ